MTTTNPDGLPELPEASVSVNENGVVMAGLPTPAMVPYWANTTPYYTKDQMLAYGRACAALTREAPTEDADWRREVCERLGLDTGCDTKWTPLQVFEHVRDIEARAAPPAPQGQSSNPSGLSSESAALSSEQRLAQGEDITLCPQHGHMYALGCAHCVGDLHALAKAGPYATGGQPPHHDRGEVEQRARELLAEQYPEDPDYAEAIRDGEVVQPDDERALRAITAALTEAKQQGPGEVTDAMVDAYLAAQAKAVQAVDDKWGNGGKAASYLHPVREACRAGLVAALTTAPQVEANRQTGGDA